MLNKFMLLCMVYVVPIHHGVWPFFLFVLGSLQGLVTRLERPDTLAEVAGVA